MKTTFSTVIVTRNRPAALALSLPLHLKQSRLPKKLFIIDSSDDPSPNQDLIAGIKRNSPIEILHVRSPAGMTVQRNIGLALVETDVVFFPDDDSLLYPDTLEHIMHVYDRDSSKRIGGVCAIEAKRPPKSVLDDLKNSYRRRRSDIARAAVASMRNKLEDVFFPDPMKMVARRLMLETFPAEDWWKNEGVTRVEWMTGFRMSFRVEPIRHVGFNELLGRYALYEDIDAGLGVLSGRLSLVAAPKAMVYHHKAPENRASGRHIGVINILNRAYVVLRTGRADRSIHRALGKYARFRAFQFRLGANSTFGLERYQGACDAYTVLDELVSAPRSELDSTYLRLRDKCLGLE